MPTLNLTTKDLNSKALKAYFKSILSLELIPLLSIISFFLSTLFISGVLGFRLLNFRDLHTCFNYDLDWPRSEFSFQPWCV